MSLINISDLTFCYEGSFDNIFENVSFQIDTDWKLGFTARNGRGKTTFLNLLLGKYEYRGTITKSVSFDYFPFVIEDKTQDTINIFENIAGREKTWELKRELSAMEVPEEVLYRSFETLSNGERTKVLLAALFLKDNSFLLIDEPTNHLDMNARRLVSRYLNTKKGFILVSHDRVFLDSCIDHILSINKTNIEIQKGNFSSWYNNKKLRDEYELQKNEKLKKDIRRLDAAVERACAWSDKAEKAKFGERNSGLRPDRGYIGHKAAKMMKRSKTIENRKLSAAREKSGLLGNIENVESLKLRPLQYFTNRLVSLKDVSVFYGDKCVCQNVGFTIEEGDRAVLCGKNGSGKTSLLKLICGEKIEHSGEVNRGNNLIVSYVPQDASYLAGDLSEFAASRGIDESLLKAILRKLDFSRVQFEKDMRDLSAGQKKKVLIAGSLCEKAHLYVWDEPLNYIDVFSRMQIEELLRSWPFTALFVEHDSAFIEEVATKKIEL
ncbi:MAG: ABC-F type ribosomal protection protein [Bacillota bacterium]|nr:ABC-F type ribosomal protection protein [Bacillota bacterium]